MRNKNRRIAHNCDAACVGVVTQTLPLHHKAPLDEAEEPELVGHRLAHRGQRRQVSLCQPRGPLGPGFAMARLQCHEKGITLQPVRLLHPKALELGPVAGLRVFQETSPRFTQALQAVRRHALEVTAPHLKHRRLLR